VDEAWRIMQQRLEWVFSRRIAFIVGATRWGTVVVERALDAHPEVAAKGEGRIAEALLPLIGQAIGHYRRRLAEAKAETERAGLPFSAAQLDATDGMHLARVAFGLALARYTEDKAAKCLVERTPEQVLALPELERLVPGAFFVHVVRDGRDEAVAAWDHNLKTKGETFAARHRTFAGFAETFARSWTNAVATARAFGREHPDRFLEVKCEHMLDRPTPTLSRLCRFLGVDWRESRLASCVEAAAQLAPEGAAGLWRERFDDAAVAAFRRHAGEMLKLFDYEA
jgi:hypothetical protein